MILLYIRMLYNKQIKCGSLVSKQVLLLRFLVKELLEFLLIQTKRKKKFFLTIALYHENLCQQNNL